MPKPAPPARPEIDPADPSEEPVQPSADGCVTSGWIPSSCVDATWAPIINGDNPRFFRPERLCYVDKADNAKCERQANGYCGWTQTPEIQACLAHPSLYIDHCTLRCPQSHTQYCLSDSADVPACDEDQIEPTLTKAYESSICGLYKGGSCGFHDLWHFGQEYKWE